MKNKSPTNWIVLSGFLILCLCSGCDPRPRELERKALSLTEGMSKIEVKTFFNGFPIIEETNEENILRFETKVFGTNTTYDSRIIFGPKRKWYSTIQENCCVYFNSNNVVVAYKYLLMD